MSIGRFCRHRFLADLVLLLLLCQGTQAKDSGALTVKFSESDPSNAEVINDDNQENTIDDVFIATDKWKEIKSGQQIPAGLHIRLNLQSGKKEAKLIDKNEDETRESLKRISDDATSEISEQAEHAFKSMDQIKKEFADLKLNVKTDYEILVDLVSRLKAENVTDSSKLEIFSNLEYIVHQFDNAQDFVKLNGFGLVIPSLNSSNDDIRSSAAFLLGSALQSNPKVQIAALENALLMTLVRIIIWDPSISVQQRAFFALSCLVRQFPLAQQNLIDQGGFSALAEMFRHKLHLSEFNKLLLKSITLINDLMQEQKYAMDNVVVGNKVTEEKLRQYKRVRLAQAVDEQGWCSLIPKLLHSPDHDDREKILRCMLTLINNCHVEFKDYQTQLISLGSEYRTLAATETEESDRYFTELYALTDDLLQLLNFTSKDEL